MHKRPPGARLLAPALASALAMVSTAGGDQTLSTCRVTYVANAGVLFESGSTRFLIDTPIREGIPPYARPSPEVSRQLENARPPFDRITAILVTHWHEDHFSPHAVAAHLTADPGAMLISSNEIVARVRDAAPSLPATRFRPTTPASGSTGRVDAGGVPVHVLRIRHNPVRRVPEEHVGFLIEGCRTVLHTGDADPQADNFQVLTGLPAVQVGLLPFWYVIDAESRRFVSSSIRPGRVLAIHIPPQDATRVQGQLRAHDGLGALTQFGEVIDLRP